MKTIVLNENKSVIKSDFKEEDFYTLIEDFLNDSSLADEERTALKNRLQNFNIAFTSMLKPYYETEKKFKRFDEMTANIVELVRRLKISIYQKKSDNTMFISFWKQLATRLDAEARKMNDNYLINCCNYLKYEVDKFE